MSTPLTWRWSLTNPANIGLILVQVRVGCILKVFGIQGKGWSVVWWFMKCDVCRQGWPLREQARSHRDLWCLYDLCHTEKHCGSGLAREEASPAPENLNPD
jgi:hypothetical protein